MRSYLDLFRVGPALVMLAGWGFSTEGAYSFKNPAAHDTVFCGNEIKIKWETDKKKGDSVVVDLLRGDSVAASLGAVPDKGKLKWTVASTLASSGDYRFRLSAGHAAASGPGAVLALSDPFAIEHPFLKILKPDSQTPWHVSTGYSSGFIEWEKRGVRGLLIVELFKGSRLAHTISSGTFRKSRYVISLPQDAGLLPSSAYRVKLTSKRNPSVFCYSDMFTLTVTDPLFDLHGVGLAWTPRIDDNQDVGIQDIAVCLGSFTDERKDTTLVGVNTEYHGRRTVTTDESVSQWCWRNARGVMQHNNVTLDSANTAVKLSGAIIEFNVLETTTYQARVTIRFKLVSKSGANVWEQAITGTASNWGRSYKWENYCECMSDAMIRTVAALLRNKDFQQALIRTKQ
jgi:hypothetical protein